MQFQEKVPDGVSRDIDFAKRSYLALARVLDLLKWENCRSAAASLRTAVGLHLKARLAAYGESNFQPKCHFSIHMSFLLERHRLLSCFVHERKHKDLKRFASDSHNANLTNSYEKGLLKQVVLAQLNSLKDLSIGDGCRLCKASDAPPSLLEHVRRFLNISPFEPLVVRASQEAFLDASARCFARDVVVATSDGVERVGAVWLFVEARGEQLVCWSPWVTLGNNRFTVVDDPQLMRVQCIKRCCIYQMETPGHALVVP